MKTLRAAALAAALATTLCAAEAGRSCEHKPAQALAVERSFALALSTARALDTSGASVVVLARAGQDLSQHGLRWSHLGWAYKDRGDGGAQGVWRVVHMLNHCGAADAALYRQGLAEFFLDDPFEYRAGYVVPAVEVQQRLLPLLRDNQRVATLHVADYNMVAYPWSTRYQQSNQWALETLALALDDAANTRERAQAWLQLKDYRPTTLHLSTMTRLGARLTAANIAFDDHPNEKRFASRIETVTVDSVFAWLQRSGLAGTLQELR
jgi:hypothetical protein